MCTQVIRREIASVPWEIVPKDPRIRDNPPQNVQAAIDYVTYFLNDANPNHETVESINSMLVQDLLELDAAALVKGYTANSYLRTPAGGLELAPRGKRQLIETWARDSGSFLAETDVNGQIYRWWQYSTDKNCVILANSAPILGENWEQGNIFDIHSKLTDTMLTKEIEEMVLGHDGKYHKTTYGYKRDYSGPMLRIKPIGVPAIHCTPEHPFLIYRHGKKKWVDANELESYDALVSPIPTETVKVNEIRLMSDEEHASLLKDKRYTPIPKVIQITDNLLELLGFYLAEGAFSQRSGKPLHAEFVTYSFHSEEHDYIAFVKEQMKIIFNTVGSQFDYSSAIMMEKGTRLAFGSAPLARWFKHNFYLKGDRTRADTKCIPDWIMKLPIKQQAVFLRGYWEGDGEKKHRYSCTTTSQTLIWQLWTLLLRQNVYGDLYETNKYQHQYGNRVIKGRKRYMIVIKGSMSKIFEGAIKLNLEEPLGRKRPRMNPIQQIGMEFLVPIARIEREENWHGNVYGCEVAESASYTVNGIACHNSYLHPSISPLEFDVNEIVYGMQYPRSYSIYGWSPLQSMDNILNSLINSAAWNTNFFSEASLPSGVLGVNGMNDEELQRFRQYWRTEIKGRWHRVAVVNTDVKYIPFALTNRDMQWLDGQKWYAKIVMALFNITQTELGFTDDIRATGKAMGAQEDVNKRKSTLPILRFIEQLWNNYVIPELSNLVMFQYQPVDRSEELMQIDVDNKDITLGKATVNEIRRKRKLGAAVWWGDESPDIIKGRITRGEPIPPLQLPNPIEEQGSGGGKPSGLFQRSFFNQGDVRLKGFNEDTRIKMAFEQVLARKPEMQRVLNGGKKEWGPIAHEQTGLPHTAQDDTLPHTQDDAAPENRRYTPPVAMREISGNRLGWGKEQREDYLGQQPETIPGASDRGEIPTAIGRKPHEYDQRDGMMNPTDVAGETGAYPLKDPEHPDSRDRRIDPDNPESHPSAMGTRSVNPSVQDQIARDARFYPGAGNNAGRPGSEGFQKPYDDTIDIRNQRNQPKDGANTYQTRVVPGDPLSGWATHPWEDDAMNREVFEGHKTGTTQVGNPAYQKQVQPPDGDEYGRQGWETSQSQLSGDLQAKDYIATATTPETLTESKLQNLPAEPLHYDQPEHDLEKHDPLIEEPRLNQGNPPMEAGPHDTLDEYRLDRLRHGPANPAATTPKGIESIEFGANSNPVDGSVWRYPGPTEDDREVIEGKAEETVGVSRLVRTPPSPLGNTREPTSDVPLAHRLPSQYRDQDPLKMFREDELMPSNLREWAERKGLDLSGKLKDQIDRFGQFTKETSKEFGALLMRKNGQLELDFVQVGEDKEVDIKPTRPLASNEEILGSFHIHPNTNEFSVWDMLSFLKSSWEKCMILCGADGKIVVAIKNDRTKQLDGDPEELRSQYEEKTNIDFANTFNFILYKGAVDELNRVA